MHVRAHACVHTHVCARVWGHPLTTPNPHPPTPNPHPPTPNPHPPTPNPHPPTPTPQGGTPGINQNSIALELIEIFQICGDFPTHGWVHGLVGGWVGSGQNTKNLKIVDLIEIIQFCLKIYDL